MRKRSAVDNERGRRKDIRLPRHYTLTENGASALFVLAGFYVYFFGFTPLLSLFSFTCGGRVMSDIRPRTGNGGSDPPHTVEPVFLRGFGVVLEPWLAREREIYRKELQSLAEWVDARFEKESIAVQREVLAQKEHEDDKKKAEARAIRRKNQERRDRFKPLVFIVATLAAWWLITLLANVVITCVPGGAPCGAAGPLIPSMTMSRPQWALVLMSVIAALWVSKMMVYPNRDFADQ
jgi:hypothetical protein